MERKQSEPMRPAAERHKASMSGQGAIIASAGRTLVGIDTVLLIRASPVTLNVGCTMLYVPFYVAFLPPILRRRAPPPNPALSLESCVISAPWVHLPCPALCYSCPCKVSMWVPYWVVNATSLPLTLQHYFHPSMLSGGGAGFYDSGSNPLFSGDVGGSGGGDDDGASEERAQHLQLTPAAGARSYAATAASTAVAAASTAAAGLASARSSPAATAGKGIVPRIKAATKHSGRGPTTAGVGVLPPAPARQPLGLGLKLLVEEEGRRLSEEEGQQHSSGQKEEEEQVAEGAPRFARGGDDEGLLL